MNKKKCTHCKVLQPLEAFSILKNPYNTTTVYRHSWCKNCLSESMAVWRKKNPKRYKEYQDRWHKEYYRKDIEASRARERERYHRNKAQTI